MIQNQYWVSKPSGCKKWYVSLIHLGSLNSEVNCNENYLWFFKLFFFGYMKICVLSQYNFVPIFGNKRLPDYLLPFHFLISVLYVLKN